MTTCMMHIQLTKDGPFTACTEVADWRWQRYPDAKTHILRAVMVCDRCRETLNPLERPERSNYTNHQNWTQVR